LIEGYERIAALAAEMPETRLVYVADREADILALMQRAHALGAPADWLIRAQHNRCLPEGGKLWAATCAQYPLGEIEFTLASRHGPAERSVHQRLWAHRVDLAGTAGVTCVIAREVDAPAGVKPMEWRLLTNRLVPDLESAVELIDWYRCRWEIETLFHVLKNAVRRVARHRRDSRKDRFSAIDR
jgi:IS4 transposase